MSARAPAPLWRSIDDRAASGIDACGAPGCDGGRRRFLGLSGAIALAGLAGCSPSPAERIVPYVRAPAGRRAGTTQFYASAFVRDGYASGVLVQTHEGRPTKIEGHPQHAASLGATDIFAQAAVLELWDPDRSQGVLEGGEPSTWPRARDALLERATALAARGGRGLFLLTEATSSPTLAVQIAALQARLPEAAWHWHQPLERSAVYAGTALAFGRALEPRYRLDRADVVLCLDADLLDGVPGHLRHARDFAARRRVGIDGSTMNRLYAVEIAPTPTGAAADERIALRAHEILAFAAALAAALGVGAGAVPAIPALARRWVDALHSELDAARGRSLIVAGDTQPAALHALAAALNHALGNVGSTVDYIEPVLARSDSGIESLRALTTAIDRGGVDTLLVLGANPVYDAAVDVGLASRLQHVPHTFHVGLYADETAHVCRWHVPAAHWLESWSDARAYDGSACIAQPALAPLYGGRDAHALLALLLGEADADAHALVQATWRERHAGADFDAAWREALVAGSIAPAAPAVAVRPPDPHAVSAALAALAQNPGSADTIDLAFRPDATIGDGRHANNAWLQELPKPLTLLCWDNAALVAPSLARAHALRDGDFVRVDFDGRSVEAPVLIAPGHADGTLTLPLGYGRRVAGRVGSGIGFDAYALRTAAAPWHARGATLTPTGVRIELARTQTHHAMHGRDIVRRATLAQFRADPAFAAPDLDQRVDASLYPPARAGEHAWAMSVNLGACIGCNACTLACQAENNIATVGRDEVRRGRELHWLRVDRYYEGEPDAPRTLLQPVPCMQCEHAPCEVVCPVGATLHDSDGLNLQVYNRCIGTRFCSNNCPYKVRRFNFLQYADAEPLHAAGRNPEVSVRMRGVMEKCTYCVQRIETARIAAERDGRALRDGDVVTACQAVCPTGAIVFGDLADAHSAVSALRRSPLDYALLGELGTRPRTHYLARLSNPNPALHDDGSGA